MTHIVVALDTFLSKDDHETIKDGIEIFCGMTNISLVMTRLHCRRAISDAVWEQLDRRLHSGKDDASFNTASELW